MDDTVGPAVDEVEIARVDAEPGGLADDEHRVDPADRVRQQRHAAAHRDGIVADVGEVAEGDLEGGGDVVEAVERDRLLAPLDLADELPAQAGTVAQSLLAEQPLLPEGAQALSQELSDVLDGAFGHGAISPLQ